MHPFGYHCDMKRNLPKNYAAIHYWLRNKYGRATKCEGKNCSGISVEYQWAKLREKQYARKRGNFMQLCRSCHARYDITEETRKKMSRVAKARRKSPETLKRLSASMKGRVYSAETIERMRGAHKGIPVVQIGIDGNVVQVWRSQSEASRGIKVNHSSFCEALKRGWKCRGFYWKKTNEL